MEAVLVVDEPPIVGRLLRIGGKRVWEGGLEAMEKHARGHIYPWKFVEHIRMQHQDIKLRQKGAA